MAEGGRPRLPDWCVDQHRPAATAQSPIAGRDDIDDQGRRDPLQEAWRRHTRKASTERLRKLWAEAANAALKAGDSDGAAVRKANAAVRDAVAAEDDFAEKTGGG